MGGHARRPPEGAISPEFVVKDGSEDGAVNFLISSIGWAESF